MIQVFGITLKLSRSVLMPEEKFRSVMGHRNITVPIGAPPVATHPKPTDAKAFCSSLPAGAYKGATPVSVAPAPRRPLRPWTLGCPLRGHGLWQFPI
jgi:hypothetical protein